MTGEEKGVIAALRRDMAGYDHVPDLDRAVAVCAPTHHGGGDHGTLGEKAAALARVWLHRNAEIIAGIRRGEHLPKDRLADLLRFNVSLPQDVRDYIAGRLDGSIKTRGRPTPQYDPAHMHHRAQMKIAGLMVRETHKANRQAGMRSGKPGSEDPYRAALRMVSKETGIPEDTLDKHATPRRKPRR